VIYVVAPSAPVKSYLKRMPGRLISARQLASWLVFCPEHSTLTQYIAEVRALFRPHRPTHPLRPQCAPRAFLRLMLQGRWAGEVREGRKGETEAVRWDKRTFLTLHGVPQLSSRRIRG